MLWVKWNGMFRSVFKIKKEEILGRWRKLQNEE
jgi:hypothetical protein